MNKVYCYDTGAALDGSASAELITASVAEGPTGAVFAYRDEDGVWQFVAPSQVDHYRRHLGVTTRTVYVDC